MAIFLIWLINAGLLIGVLMQEGVPEYKNMVDIALGFMLATVLFQFSYRFEHGRWFP